MNAKKLIGLLAIALLVYWVIRQPDSAAQSVGSIFAWLRSVGDNISLFLGRLL